MGEAQDDSKGQRQDGGQERGLKLDLTPALASINYNSIVAAQERGVSSDDETPPADAPDIPIEDARTAIGVSISREQTRLTSPQTPAVEKAAVIERAGDFFSTDGAQGTLFEEPEEDEDIEESKEPSEPVEQQQPPARAEEEVPSRIELPERSPRRTPVQLPSPWRVDSKARWQTGGKGRAGLFDGIFNRRRASSGPDAPEGWQKSLMSSLPSMPKGFSLPSPFAATHDGGSNDSQTRPRPSGSPSPHRSDTSPAIRQRSYSDRRVPPSGTPTPRGSESTPTATPRAKSPQPRNYDDRTPARLLRRSTSDHSLSTLRTLSVVESLGDDSRFEDVSAQVNSRIKAIKDSWQDSSIKLPNLSNFTPDFMRDRAGSLNKRNSLALPSNNTSQGSSRDLSQASNQRQPVDPMTRQPYTSAKAAASDVTAGRAASHPHFTNALEQLEGDVVVLGGYRGSILRSAEPPNRQVWVPVKVGLNLRKVNLEVGFEEGDDARASESVIAGGMLTHIGPVDIARRLFKRLRNCQNARTGKLRVHDYGYDWRLDPAYLSSELIKFLEGLPCNKRLTPRDRRGATVIAHSLGGLITRHAVNQRPELFKGVIYAGVPNTCVNILGPMRNGDEVLLSDRVLTAQVNFSIRTSFALLPLDGNCFFDKNTKERYHVDFFDPQTWVDYRLSPCVARPLPPLVAPPKPGGITGYVSSMASALPSIPGRARKPSLRSKDQADPSTTTPGTAGLELMAPDTADSKGNVAHGNIDRNNSDAVASPRTAVTLPHEKAMAYLTRTLASVKKFKQELDFIPAHAEGNKYPPNAVIYGKSTPTVYGAKVDGREGIKHADAYDELAFASGDGVVLARAAMVPPGYKVARGGVVSSERGHVTLLSDLEAVGRCLEAVQGARRRGLGLST
ncbi:uncharacterized protein LTR77_009782 [Saxophila tyrrhenica]|uniref:Uncharacterized protein n=1 Tax=Saxophila tyrrhenica TaxID=1690608 RepID=A0AAV9NXH6_9PEZI|nr:hypothetical protein LTR77_009782 [Saxophila tyrrhenica]